MGFQKHGVGLLCACIVWAISPALAQSDIKLGMPIDCRLGQSCWVVNLVDLDAGPEARDYQCQSQTYDGNKGTDFAIRDLKAMQKGVRVLAAPDDGAGRVAPGAVARMLAEAGVTRLLIEGGGAVAAAFLAADLVDRIHAFRAPMVVGGDGLPAIGALGLDRVAEAPRFLCRDISRIDDDVVELYQRIAV